MNVCIRDDPYPFKEGIYYPYPIRIRENYGYPQNIYPRIHIRAWLTGSDGMVPSDLSFDA